MDATADKLAARAITEARGGRTLADVLEFGLENILQVHEQGLVSEKPLPEAAAYPDNLKGSLDGTESDLFCRSMEYGSREGKRSA
ncbi:MAG: hypothetical protein ACREQW_09830 [Candidatus Binatia bacterium]